MGPGVFCPATCPRDGSALATVTIGQPVAGTETSAVLRCPTCHHQWHLWVRLIPAPPDPIAPPYSSRAHGTTGHPGSGRTHGIRATYVDGCRCAPCSAADAAYQHQRTVRRQAERRANQETRR